MTRFTRLETAVMEALAHDLRRQVPDLAGQFEESRPSQRRNSGFGLFTEMIVDRHRPAPVSGPTGDFGAVHAMVGNLADPIAFKVRVRNGVLMGLLGDSYGQDTRAIDFATTPFDQVFLVNDRGESIAFEPTRHRPASPLLDLQKHEDHIRPVAPPEPKLVNVGPLQKLQETGVLQAPSPAARSDLGAGPYDVLASLLSTSREPPAAMATDEKTALRVGLWFAIFAIGSVLVLAFDASPILVVVLGGLAGRFLQTDRGLALLKRALAELRKAQAKRS